MQLHPLHDHLGLNCIMLIIPAPVPSYYSGKKHKYNYDNGVQIVERIIAYFLDEHDLTSGTESQFTSAAHHSNAQCGCF